MNQTTIFIRDCYVRTARSQALFAAHKASKVETLYIHIKVGRELRGAATPLAEIPFLEEISTLSPVREFYLFPDPLILQLRCGDTPGASEHAYH
jgi:hypothetical protein